MKPGNAIEVENLSKRYFVGRSIETRQTTWSKSLLRSLVGPAKRFRAAIQGKNVFAGDQELWSLRDVSFEVKEGAIVGIIGANGSGKSTLLKILSHITHPTSGVARIRGAVGSLLEVGTGFHPELTGRENIYMNGAVLGMSSRDINQVFDEIVTFSGVGDFLDTPVKRYSSGMRVRLAFSVAAHFKPEVLLVDEVLSVGDAEFQKRGLGKMSSVSQEGRTVLMVSHNLSAILSHCDWVIWLNKGQVMAIGEPQEVVSQYLLGTSLDSTSEEGEKHYSNIPPESPYPVELLAMRTLDDDGKLRSQFLSTRPITVEIEYKLKAPIPFLRVGFEMKESDDTCLFRTYHNDTDEIVEYDPHNPDQIYKVRGTIPANLLNKGTYHLDPLMVIHRGDWIVNEVRGLLIHVTYDVPNRNYVIKNRPGVIAPILDWQAVTERESV